MLKHNLPDIRHWLALTHDDNEEGDDKRRIQSDHNPSDLPESIGGEEAKVG